ncbi:MULTISPECIES: phosphotransferase family protein [Streptomyces]|uniref:Phosphotransferase family protein n=1 Tax=Streptomyces noboritoensis TaxID=67337 RepID=A0ABV6TCH3_9ACTN|nr:phosphotransferase [Streptomyces melanogenes]GGP78700.1 aminoglycoside phosphotransferase [Streptomyces melanogenes]
MTHVVIAPGGFDKPEMHQVLQQACAMAGLDHGDARLLRGHTNAVILLEREQTVVKIARRGTNTEDVARTVAFVRHLMDLGFPTVPLHPIGQPVIIDGHATTFWHYLPQPPHPVTAAQLAKPLHALHTLPTPPLVLPRHDNIAAIRRSLATTSWLPGRTLAFLNDYADQLAHALTTVDFALPDGVIQGDPQHRNALHTGQGEAVLCDWDTVTRGQPEWDLVTVEIHCRRFGHGQQHYQAFADAYGFDITRWSGYPTLAAIRELRMITTNARKVPQAPSSQREVERRIAALQSHDRQLRWNIL